MIKPKLSLRLIFIIPLLTLIMLTTGMIGYFSFSYGQQAVDELASQLQNEIAAYVHEHLQDFFAVPTAINEGNARGIRMGLLDLDKPTALERHFWNQVQAYKGVSPIYFGYAQGGIVMAIRRELETGRLGKEIKISTSRGKQADAQYMYLADDNGNRRELVEIHPNYDVRNRPWFKKSVDSGKPGWSPIFTNFGGEALVISRNEPVYGDEGELLGVVCADLNLTYISDFLRDLEIGKNGRAFIIERSGALVASSAREEPLRKLKGNTKVVRVHLSESDDSLVRSAAQHLRDGFRIRDGMTRQVDFAIQGEKQILIVKPFKLNSGPDWLIGVVIPVSDFMASIYKNRQIALSLIAIVVFISLALSILAANWLIRPILNMSLAATAATQGDWIQATETNRQDELGALVRTFNKMIGQLSTSFEKLKESEYNLREAERKYRTVADFTYDWEYWEAPDGSLNYISPSCERITGYTRSDFVDHPELIQEIILPEDLAEWEAHNHSSNMGSVRGQCQFRIRAKDGTIRWIEHVCRPVYKEQGSYAGVRASNRDITRLKLAEQEARENREVLARLDRTATLGELAGSIAHELNQPHTGILSNAQAGEMLLRQGTGDYAGIEEILTDIIADTKRAGDILRNLRDLYGKQQTEFKLLGVNAMVKDTLRILKSEFVFHNVTIHTDFSDTLPDVMGNRIQLQQVLINLINNAIQVMQQSAKADRSISVITSRGNVSEVQIQVEDTGSGIDQEGLEHIFEPFTTLKPGGLGMGLSISRSIVQAHGGRIWAENIPAGGARMSFTLPAVEEES